MTFREVVLMHAVGRMFPRGDRSPALQPMAETRLRAMLATHTPQWHPVRTQRVASGFYTSQALELRPAGTAA